MADGLNDARALRVLEIMNDFRTLQVHIRTYITAAAATATPETRNLVGYQLLSRCQASATSILNAVPNTGGIAPSSVPQDDAQMRSLRRVILDASVRRFKAHKIYLIVSAVRRWIAGRQQVLGGDKPNGRHEQALRALDQRLQTDASQATDDLVYNNLRQGDRNRGYWLNDDPSLSTIQSSG